MKKLLLVTLLASICFSSFGQIRKTKWGNSKAAVKKAEGAAPVDDATNKLLYFTTLSNLDAALIYTFNNNKLSGVTYIIQEEYVNDNNHIRDYESLKSQLEIKYGKPGLDKQDWSNSLYKDEPERYGLAVSAGHLDYSAFWQIDDMSIGLLLTGENFECTLTVMYISEEFNNHSPSVDPGL